MILKLPATFYAFVFTCLVLAGCNGGGDSASSAATSAEAPSTLDLVGSEIAFNPTIRFTSATDCTYDNTLATENTLPQPTAGLIQATYTAVSSAGTITIKVSSTDSSFTDDLILVMTGWSDLDKDGFIDQFAIRPSLGETMSLPEMTAQFTSNPPMLPGAVVSASSLPVFAGGDSNRSPTSSEWNDYVVGKQLVLLYTDGEVSTLNMQSSSAYTTSDAPGNTVQGTYAYERVDDTSGRLTTYESRSYGNPLSAFAVNTQYVTSERQAVFTLNFYNTDPLSDSLFGKPGGLGIHFQRTTDIEKYSVAYVDTDLDGVADSDIKESTTTASGSLRVYNDASLLTE
ncbi:MAG: hypothetical protein HN531_02710 [Opitutae bacterium]|nr:hypothetical protein [Opitutae bacterium]